MAPGGTLGGTSVAESARLEPWLVAAFFTLRALAASESGVLSQQHRTMASSAPARAELCGHQMAGGALQLGWSTVQQCRERRLTSQVSQRGRDAGAVVCLRAAPPACSSLLVPAAIGRPQPQGVVPGESDQLLRCAQQAVPDTAAHRAARSAAVQAAAEVMQW